MLTDKENKGSWSEPYVLLKLLSDGVLKQGNADLSESDDVPYQVIACSRDEHGDKALVNKLYQIKTNTVAISVDGNRIGDVARADLAHHADLLYYEITNGKGAFGVSDNLGKFLTRISCDKIKAGSSAKTDISVVIHDHKTGTDPTLGFSIKSQLGGPSTLINASVDNTNFSYRLNRAISSEEAAKINTISPSRNKIQARIKALEDQRYNLVLNGVIGETYRNNLLMLDGDLCKILSECLLYYYRGSGSRLKEIVAYLESTNPLGYPKGEWPFYAYKLKKLLVDSALGMMPATIWDGSYDATGGYIIVKSGGDLISYHLIKKNLFEDYLLSNVKLETPSSSKHNFGQVYFDDNNNAFFNLNLQMRFVK